MRRLENADEEKFWEAWIKNDLIFCYRFGKLDSSGHTKIKKFATREEAEAALEEALQAKLDEGYEEQTQAAAAEEEEEKETAKEEESEEEESEDEEEESEDEEEESEDEDSKEEDEEEEEEGKEEEEEGDEEEEEEDEEEEEGDKEEEEGDEEEEEGDEEEEEGDEEEEEGDEEEEEGDEEEEEEDEEEEEGDKEEKAPKRGKKAEIAAAPEPEKPREIEKEPIPPPRRVAARPKAADIAKAREALETLRKGLGARSWKRGVLVRRARRALEGVAGIDPTKDPTLGAAFDALMASVTAAKERLSLADALVLLNQVDASAFERAASRWKGKEGPAAPALAALHAVSQSIEDAELALYVGRLVANRAMTRAAFKKIWERVGPLAGEKLSKALARVDTEEDKALKSRISDLS